MAKTNQIFDWPQNEIENNDIITYYRHHEPILTGSKVKGNRFTPHEPYEDLKTNILSGYPAETIRSILFNGIHHGGGCTTTTVNFAHSIASDSRNKVLLIDVN